MLEILKIIGAILGIVVFIWKVRDLYSRYLHIDVTVRQKEDGSISALTTVENKGELAKKIDNALLLIGPEKETPEETFRILTGMGVISTNEIVDQKFERTIERNGGRQIIPLKLYYEENLKIGDEKITYRTPIDDKSLPRDIPISVRFFVIGEGKYHRSTHDCFIHRVNPDS